MNKWSTWTTETISSSPYVGGLVGWICPICGRGLSPYVMQCPCSEEKKIVVTKTGTGTE